MEHSTANVAAQQTWDGLTVKLGADQTRIIGEIADMVRVGLIKQLMVPATPGTSRDDMAGQYKVTVKRLRGDGAAVVFWANKGDDGEDLPLPAPMRLAAFVAQTGKVVLLPTAAAAPVVQGYKRIPRALGITKLADLRRVKEGKLKHIAALQRMRDEVMAVAVRLGDELLELGA